MLDIYNQIKLFIYEYKTKIIISSIGVLILSLLIILPISFVSSKDNEEKLVYDDILNENKEDIVETEEKIENVPEDLYVDIKGYVNNPGVYSIEKGKRVVDVINKAGGLKEGADTTLLNLSLEVFDSMVIVIYSNNEINDYLKTLEVKEQKEEICKIEIINDACICNDNINDSNDNLDSIDKEENSNEDDSKTDTKEEILNSKININKASLEELITLPKIGESKAKAIIDYRLEFGNFKDITEIKNVSGIGDSLFESIKDYITI